MHSCIHSFIHSFIRSFIHLLTVCQPLLSAVGGGDDDDDVDDDDSDDADAYHGSERATCDPIWRHCQAGSLTGAVHLSNRNAGVPR